MAQLVKAISFALPPLSDCGCGVLFCEAHARSRDRHLRWKQRALDENRYPHAAADKCHDLLPISGSALWTIGELSGKVCTRLGKDAAGTVSFLCARVPSDGGTMCKACFYEYKKEKQEKRLAKQGAQEKKKQQKNQRKRNQATTTESQALPEQQQQQPLPTVAATLATGGVSAMGQSAVFQAVAALDRATAYVQGVGALLEAECARIRDEHARIRDEYERIRKDYAQLARDRQSDAQQLEQLRAEAVNRVKFYDMYPMPILQPALAAQQQQYRFRQQQNQTQQQQQYSQQQAYSAAPPPPVAAVPMRPQ